MGCYDSIMVLEKCPYCLRNVTIECQTKELGQMLNSYHNYPSRYGEKPVLFYPNKTHMVPSDYRWLKYINVLCDCRSISCRFDADRRDIIQQTIPSGFGRLFDAKIKIFKYQGNYYFGDLYDIKKDNWSEEKLSKYQETLPPKVRKELQSFIKQSCHSQEVIGIRFSGRILDKNFKEICKWRKNQKF